MATEFPIGGSFKVNVGNNGDTLILSVPDYNEMGAFSVHFVDAGETGGPAFAGTLQVVARAGSKQAADDGVTFRSHPHRPSFLNGQPQTGAPYAHTYALITSSTLTMIPASGLSVGLLVSCSSGSGKLYITPTVGESAVG